MNVTLSWDETLVKAARHAAVDSNQSLSAWLADLAKEELNERSNFEQDRDYALKILEEGIEMDGKPLSREEIYQERYVDFS